MIYDSSNISLVRANTTSTAYDSGDITENTVNAYANLFYPYILDDANNRQNVSLTIDILNKKELEEETKDIVNKQWVSSDRLQNNIPISKAIWGFKESFHGFKKSRAISNAFAFSGQQINFQIAYKGQGAGYVNNQWLYLKSTITVSAIDIIRGTTTILKTFSSFETDINDTSRFFTWTVPALDDTTYSQYQFYGIVVLRIDVENIYYLDANREKICSDAIPAKNQNHLQFLIYSGSKEIIEVSAPDINILTSTPSYTDTLTQIFDKTIFYTLQSLNQNPLTDAQKRAIIADQIAFLFISQHPTITADFYPGKIIGAGANQATPPRKVIDKVITYSKRYPEVIPMVKDRLFGMLVTYKAFNFITDIDKYVSDFYQSTQSLRDPARTIWVDSEGVVADDLGVDGIIFNPFSLTVVNSEMVLDTPYATTIDTPLVDGIVDIHNITITDALNNPLSPHTSVVKVGFDVVYGESNIAQIRYSVFSQQALNYKTYVDTTGLTRSHTFTLDNEIVPKPSKRGDVVVVQIDIEDVTGGVMSFMRTEALYGYTARPLLRDLKIYQRNDGSQIVDFYYTYDGNGEINNAYVYVQFSGDLGVTWSEIPITTLKGDVGEGIISGRRRVTWQPAVDMVDISYINPILCRISLYDVESDIAWGDVLTGALVWDITKPEIAVMRVKEA